MAVRFCPGTLFKTKDQRLKTRKQKMEVTYRGFWNDASDFLQAYCAVKKQLPQQISKAKYYLLGHSLELILKAFILKAGGEVKFVKEKIGHDLKKALLKCKQQGLDVLGEEEETIIKILSQHYCSKDFEYTNPGFKQLPALDDIEKIVYKLLHVVRPKSI
jgi:hypothetical protein